MNDVREIVIQAFRILLGREPESNETIDFYVKFGDALSIFKIISMSPEYRASKRSPFWHFASTYNAELLVRSYARSDLVADPNLVINFLGVRIEPHYVPSILLQLSGIVEDIPIPANWHADLAEWAAALRAVDLASETFTVAELGCGWGCWINNTGVAAKARGLRPNLIGVEGDIGHINFARDCCALNGFSENQIEIYHGIAAATDGIALFPKQDEAGAFWDLTPIFGANEQQALDAVESGKFDRVKMIPLAEVIGLHEKLDLLHIDIQGGEADLIEQTLPVLAEKVAYIVIGTHSRSIEGRLFKLLVEAGWLLEIERPALITLSNKGASTWADGVQGWRNLRILPC